MAAFLRIEIDAIVVPERIRPVDEEHVKVIAASIASEGLLNPITVRHTPNAKGGSYMLVAGAHRLRAVEMNGGIEVDAIVVKADKDTAQILEISENLFRNELSVIDRAVFVQTLRDLYESEHGKITRGGDQRSKGQLARLIEGKGFASYVTARLGLSADAMKRLNCISQNLNPDLRGVLRGTSVADNQAWLLKLAKMEPSRQRAMALAFGKVGGDIRAALDLVEGDRYRVGAIDEQGKIYARLVGLWGQAEFETRAAFAEYLRGGEANDDEEAA